MAEKAKGMIFTAESVRAILGGTKSQTRRVVPEKVIDEWHDYDEWVTSVMVPGGKRTYEKEFYWSHARCEVGDIIYVKEAISKIYAMSFQPHYIYKADCTGDEIKENKWRSPMLMPKAAARIFLRVTDVKIERLGQITEEDSNAEGLDSVEAYRTHWDEINGKKNKGAYKWDNDPWVFVYTFEVITREQAEAAATKVRDLYKGNLQKR